MAPERKIVVHISTSADGYIARPDGDLDWLTERPALEGFYGIPEFARSVDAKILGRKTFEVSRQLGASFGEHDRHYVVSRHPQAGSCPPGVEFVTEPVRDFVARLRKAPGKNIWMMGGGELIASFLDEGAIDEFIITIVPTFIGDGIPLIGRRHRHVPLHLRSIERFSDGVAQLHYDVHRADGSP
jgi:dihydrofolate reductase